MSCRAPTLRAFGRLHSVAVQEVVGRRIARIVRRDRRALDQRTCAQPMFGSLVCLQPPNRACEQAQPAIPGASSLESNKTWSPMQILSTGRPAAAAARTAWSRPDARSRVIASPKCPSPGGQRPRLPPSRPGSARSQPRRPTAPAPWPRCEGCSSHSRARQREAHERPFVDGTPVTRAFGATATRSARATALKQASMTW